jgi:hypothetical protein
VKCLIDLINLKGHSHGRESLTQSRRLRFAGVPIAGPFVITCNTGISDAVNLAWKLAAVLHGRANGAILDSYETERIAFARRLVATTDQAFTGVTSAGAIARTLRLHIVPFLIPSLFAFRAVRRFMFRTVSQTVVNYRTSMLSRGRAGRSHAGDRLPWAKTNSSGINDDNFTPLTSLDWQVHVYGNAGPEIRALCEQQRLPLHVFRWRRDMSRNGLLRNAVYLVRPGGYLGVVARKDKDGALTSYFKAHQINPCQ